jgi:hypothetical protein
MTSPAFFAQPPRIATWLVNLFTLPDDESIVGDLFEEFCQLVSISGVAVARRWYWRQSLKTIVHLVASAFLGAPWLTAAAVVGGFFLHGFVSEMPDRLLSAVTDRHLAFWSTHFQVYLWLLKGMWMAHVMSSLLVGGVVAFAAKGREMAATMMLAFVLCAMVGAAFAWAATQGRIDFVWILWSCTDPFAMVVGGVMVRARRSATTTRPSCA